VAAARLDGGIYSFKVHLDGFYDQPWTMAVDPLTDPSLSSYVIPITRSSDDIDHESNVYFKTLDLGSGRNTSGMKQVDLIITHSVLHSTVTIPVLLGDVVDKANCYIVKPGNHVIIPVGIINDSGIAQTQQSGLVYYNLGRGNPLTPQIVWQTNHHNYLGGLVEDMQVFGVGPEAYLYVKTKSVPSASPHGVMPAEGNAVVGVTTSREQSEKDEAPYPYPDRGEELLRWSWHLWITEYDPDATAQTFIKKFGPTPVMPGENHVITVMDRNLGAGRVDLTTNPTPQEAWTTWGMFYQWGRKDPFPTGRETIYGDGLYVIPNSEFTTSIPVDYVTAPKSTIIYPMRPAGGGWTGFKISGGFQYPWGTSSAKGKGVHDPCPPGWQVPVYDYWGTGHTITVGQLVDLDEIGEVVESPADPNYWWFSMPNRGGLFPGTGQRNIALNTHTLWEAQTYLWISDGSSTTYNTFGINKNVSGYNTSGSKVAASGYNIRCVKDGQY
jgi:hypothetical protein